MGLHSSKMDMGPFYTMIAQMREQHTQQMALLMKQLENGNYSRAEFEKERARLKKEMQDQVAGYVLPTSKGTLGGRVIHHE